MTDNDRQQVWAETIVSEGSTVHMQNHPIHHNDVIVENELLFFSNGFKSIHGCCIQILTVVWAVYFKASFPPAHASLISPFFTTVDLFSFRNREKQ